MSTNFASFLLPNSGGGGTGGGSMPGQQPNFGSNQYMQYPSMGSNNYSPYPGSGMNSVYPMQNNVIPGSGIPSGGYGGGYSTPAASSYTQELPSGQYTTPTVNPALTSAYGSYLGSQLGKGVSPFDLSTWMP